MNIQKKISLFLISFISVSLPANISKETTYSRISKQLLKTTENCNYTPEEIESLLNPDLPQGYDEKKAEEIFNKKRQRHERIKILFKLFNDKALSKNEENNSTNCLTSSMFWQNIELFCGQNNPAINLLAKISRANTKAGDIMIAEKIANPTTDIEELQRRQSIVNTLINNEELFNALDKITLEYAKIENDLISFWDNQVFTNLFGSDFYYPPEAFLYLPEKIVDIIFPPKIKKSLNQNSTALSFNAYLNNFGSYRVIKAKLEELGFDRLVQLFKLIYINPCLPEEKITDGWTLVKNQYDKFINQLNNLNTESGAWNTTQNSWNTFWTFDGIGFKLYNQLSAANTIARTIKSEARNIKTLKTAYSKLKSASVCVQSLTKIKNIIDQNDDLSSQLKCFDDTQYIFDKESSNSKSFDKLIQLLSKDSFLHKTTAIRSLLNRGKILAASFIMASKQNYLVDIMQTIGKIDAYLSIAKLYKESQNKKATYCFPCYLDQEKPYLKLDQFWTPFINQDNVVTNNIELGNQDKQRNAIISGPNAGGKSTILKAIIVNTLFAQTIGIAPAKEFVLTPFTYIDTYLNIVDDIAGGNSLFKSEVLRVKELLARLKLLNPHKCLVIMDEMFSGTNPKEGQAASYAVGKYIATLPNTINVLASHYSMLTELEEKTDGIFKNYKVSVIKKEDGSLIYPFVLEVGKTDQTIAIDILENEEFEAEIIKDARDIISDAVL